MTLYAIYEPQNWKIQESQSALQTLFVAHKFNIGAFIFSVPWLLWKRMWRVLIAYCFITTLLALIAMPTAPFLAPILNFALCFLLGLEAANFYGWSLKRKGWQHTAFIEARNEEEAERIYFASMRENLLPQNMSALVKEKTVSTPSKPYNIGVGAKKGTKKTSKIAGLFPNT